MTAPDTLLQVEQRIKVADFELQHTLCCTQGSLLIILQTNALAFVFRIVSSA